MKELKHYWELKDIHYILKFKYDEIKDDAKAEIIRVYDGDHPTIEKINISDMELRNLISSYKQTKFGGGN